LAFFGSLVLHVADVWQGFVSREHTCTTFCITLYQCGTHLI